MNVEKTQRQMPPYIIMNGMTYFVKSCDEELATAHLVTKARAEDQCIAVKSTLPFDRQCSYLCREIVRQLFLHVNLMSKADMKAADGLGTALYVLLSHNTFDWVTDLHIQPPSIIHIQCHDYDITIKRDEHLEDCGLCGEINYNNLCISLYSSMKKEILLQVLCHEILHGLVFESGLPDRYNNERTVQMLSLLLYMLLRDNDFTFMRG